MQTTQIYADNVAIYPHTNYEEDRAADKIREMESKIGEKAPLKNPVFPGRVTATFFSGTASKADMVSVQSVEKDSNTAAVTGSAVIEEYKSEGSSNLPGNEDYIIITICGGTNEKAICIAVSEEDGSLWVRIRNNGWKQWKKISGESGLLGGELEGEITAKGGVNNPGYSGALNMNNSNIYGVNAIYTADPSEGAWEGIHFYRDETHTDTLWVANGNMYFVENRELNENTAEEKSKLVLHSGNYGRYCATADAAEEIERKIKCDFPEVAACSFMEETDSSPKERAASTGSFFAGDIVYVREGFSCTDGNLQWSYEEGFYTVGAVRITSAQDGTVYRVVGTDMEKIDGSRLTIGQRMFAAEAKLQSM